MRLPKPSHGGWLFLTLYVMLSIIPLLIRRKVRYRSLNATENHPRESDGPQTGIVAAKRQAVEPKEHPNARQAARNDRDLGIREFSHHKEEYED